MSTSKADRPRIIELPRIYDPRGNLTFIQNGDPALPFDIARAFWTYDIPAGAVRGSHAHRRGHEFVVPVSGCCDVVLSDGRCELTFTLNRPFRGLYIPPMHWLTINNFASGTVYVALTSNLYDEADYIRDYEEFLTLTHQQ